MGLFISKGGVWRKRKLGQSLWIVLPERDRQKSEFGTLVSKAFFAETWFMSFS